MVKKTGMIMLLGMLGAWGLGCAPAGQMVKSDLPEATPTPLPVLTATVTAMATAIATPTPASVKAPAAMPKQQVAPTVRGPKVPKFHARTPLETSGSQAAPPAAALVAPVSFSAAVQAATVSAANSMATATTAIAAATAEAVVPGGVRTSRTKVPTKAAGQVSASISKIFMGLGLLILLGGCLYALRQLQAGRRASRRNQEAQTLRAQAAATQVITRPTSASRNTEREPAAGQGHPVAPTPAAGAAEHTKPAPRRVKSAGARKTPRKAALRAARPAVKTVRLSGKRAQAPIRKRRKTA